MPHPAARASALALLVALTSAGAASAAPKRPAEAKKPAETKKPADAKKADDKKSDAKQPAATIKLARNGFTPDEVTIKKGQTVRWVNDDNRDYSIIAKDQSFKSGDLKHGESFEFTFNDVGSFDYLCILHPRLLGKITVTE